MNNKQVVKILVGGFFGSLIFGIFNTLLWYYVTDMFDRVGYAGRDFGLAVSTVMGLVFGLIGGGIIGGIIAGFRMKLALSFIVGAVVHGILPFVLNVAVSPGEIGLQEAPKDLRYAIYGQFVLGGLLSILISVINEFVFHKLEKESP